MKITIEIGPNRITQWISTAVNTTKTKIVTLPTKFKSIHLKRYFPGFNKSLDLKEQQG